MFDVFGRRLEGTRINTRVTFTGVGSIMNLRITWPMVGVVEIVHTCLPIAPLAPQPELPGQSFVPGALAGPPAQIERRPVK